MGPIRRAISHSILTGMATTYYVRGVDGAENRRVAGKQCTFRRLRDNTTFYSKWDRNRSTTEIYTYGDGIPRFMAGSSTQVPECHMPPSEWTFIQVEELEPYNVEEAENPGKKCSKNHYRIVWNGSVPELVNSNGHVTIVNNVKRSAIDRSGETADSRTIYLLRPPGEDRIAQVVVSDFLEQQKKGQAPKKRKNLIAAGYSEFRYIDRHDPISVMPHADFQKMCRLHQQHCGRNSDYPVDIDADDYVKYALLRKRMRGEGLEDEYEVNAPIFDGGAVLYPFISSKRRRRE